MPSDDRSASFAASSTDRPADLVAELEPEMHVVEPLRHRAPVSLPIPDEQATVRPAHVPRRPVAVPGAERHRSVPPSIQDGSQRRPNRFSVGRLLDLSIDALAER